MPILPAELLNSLDWQKRFARALERESAKGFAQPKSILALAPIKREGSLVCDCCYRAVGDGHEPWCAYA